MTTVLILDEAHHLDAEILEEVRLLTNLESAEDKLLQIVLVGQPELDEKLDSIGLRQLKQRIALRAGWSRSIRMRPRGILNDDCKLPEQTPKRTLCFLSRLLWLCIVIPKDSPA